MSMFALAIVASIQLAAVRAEIECIYPSRAGDDMLTASACAWRDQRGQIHILPEQLRRLTYDRRGLATVYAGGWRYVTRDGRSAAVMARDNGPDPFADGLARSPVGAKIG